MEASENKIEITKTARFFTLGNPSKAKRVWFVCHGYGQLAKYFIRSFQALHPEEDFIVAAEGFHRFYLQNFSGRVGANWMTKEERLDDIADYVSYLDQLYMKIASETDLQNKKIIVLGFSQGAATVSRWLAAGNSRADQLILWAGSFPPDLDMRTAVPIINQLNMVYCIGDEDELIPKEKIVEVENFLKDHKITYSLFPYSGGHKIPADALQNLTLNYL